MMVDSKTEIIVAIGLVVAMLLSISYGMNELSMSIASGLVGYMGGKHIGKEDNK